MPSAMVSWIFDVHLQQINHPFLKIIAIFFFSFPFVSPLSFNFDSFSPNVPEIIYENSSFAANNVIQLTRNQQDESSLASIGRATYAKPLQLWDKASRNLTDFTSNFSFIINSLNRSVYADGMVFFLAPNGSRIPNNVTKGGSMGLTTDYEPLNSTDHPFVAVEFDIYSNPEWDPPSEHVGININSMKSVANVSWWSDVSIRQGLKHDVWISYDSVSTNLSLIFTGFRNNSYVIQRLSYLVDLREYLPELVTFGFSAATGNISALHSILSWSFSSNLEIQGNVTDPLTASVPSSDSDFGRNRNETDPGIVMPGSTSSKTKTGVVIGVTVGGLFLLGGIGLLTFFFWNKRRGMMNEGDDNFGVSIVEDFEQGRGPKRFTYNELIKATNRFSPEEKLGEGGFGGVYKGFLKGTNSYVAVKRVSSGSKQGIKEYASEVKIISRLRHRNLVQLLGWCHEKKELLLVYEFMPNGSLDYHLFKGKSLLNWGIRFKIAQGLASALLYLHEEWEQCVVHRDIKSSNVMLDSNFNSKLGDFGLARLVDHEKGSQTTVLAGTMGYMAPECAITGKASKETDVFSFGVVALEIATGRRPINPKAQQSQVNLVEWAWSLYGTGNLLQAADPQLGTDINMQEIEHLMIVGLWCAHPDSNLRPSIRQAILVLNFEAPLPNLPLRMPVATYYSPPVDMLLSPYGTTGSGSSQTVSSAYSDNTESSKFTVSSGKSSPSASLLYTR